MSRLPLLALAVASLVVGLWSGLTRAGVALAPPSPEALAAHGALMVGATLGTLIALERAVALGRRWAFAAPLASGLSGVAAALGAPWVVVTGGLVVASSIFAVVTLRLTLRQPALFTLVMCLGAFAWLFGNVAWSGGVPVHRLVLLWVAFLVLTIAGERLELSRLRQPPTPAVVAFVGIVLGFVSGSVLSASDVDAGARVAGISAVALAAWLVRYDIVRRTLRSGALPRFIAVCLLGGYVWLIVGGALLMRSPGLVPGLEYDAILHALFLGFVFSMIFGHAPVILPAVLGVPVPFSRALYLPLALLHASLFLRVGADLGGASGLRAVAAVANVVALASYPLVVLAGKLVRSRSGGAKLGSSGSAASRAEGGAASAGAGLRGRLERKVERSHSLRGGALP